MLVSGMRKQLQCLKPVPGQSRGHSQVTEVASGS